MSDNIHTWRTQLDKSRRAAFDKGYKRAKADKWSQYVRNYNDVAAIADGCRFDADAAAHVTNFIETFLCLTKGAAAGKPFILMPWQRDAVERAFGWKRSNGNRRFRKIYIEIPKKNGKSELLAAIALYMLCMDGEETPEVYGAAVDRQQARLVFDEAARMAAASPQLRKRLRHLPSTGRLVYPAKNGLYRVLSADVAQHEGLDISCALVDELHVHKKRDLWDTLLFGGVARVEPLLFVITTAGEYDESSIGWEQHSYGTRVIEGVIEDIEYLAIIYAANKDDDWTDPAVWRRANPALGTVLREEDMAAACREAENEPRKLSAFLRYRLNIWVQATEAWMDIDQWKSCVGDYDDTDMEGKACWGGLDLSSSDDLTAFALIFPASEAEGKYRLLSWHWIPRDRLVEKSRQNNATYEDWYRNGWLNLTEGDVIDLKAIRAAIGQLGKRFDIRGICYDRLFMATEIAQNLQDEDGFEVVAHGMGYLSMNPSMVEMERLVLGRRIEHDGNPLFLWEMANVVAKIDPAGNVKPDKSERRRKIDGPVAALMALTGALKMDIHKRSVLDDPAFSVW